MNVAWMNALGLCVAGILIVITISLVKSMIHSVSNLYQNEE